MDNDIEEKVKNYFSDIQWNGLADIEKTRCINLYVSYEMQKELGLNPKFPNFLNNSDSHGEISSESEDKEWVPEVEKKRKPVKHRFNPPKRKSSIISKIQFRPTNKDCDKQEADASLSASQSAVQHIWHAVTFTTDVEDKVKIGHYFPLVSNSEDVLTKNLKKEPKSSSTKKDVVDTPQERRYPKRSCGRKNYNETVAMNNDDYIFCDQCNEDHEGGCSIHPLILLINNNVSRDGSDKNRGKTTTPWPLYISQSKIKEAGLGVWTSAYLPRGLVFGPYEGRIYLDIKPGEESGYGWKIRNKTHPGKCVDAVDLRISNWLRFVNCSRSYAETNLVAFQYKGEIYYKTVTDIHREVELMVWYGDEYGKELGYKLEDSANDKRNGININEGVKRSQLSSAAKYCRKQSLFTKRKETTEETLLTIYKDAAYSMIASNDDNNNNKVCLGKEFKNNKEYDCDTCIENNIQKLETIENTKISCNVKDDVSLIKKREILAIQEPNVNIGKEINSKARNIDQRKDQNKAVCSYCNKELIKTYLKAHLRIHTGELPFACQYCEKKFNQKCLLITHIRTHTGETPFECKFCDKKFNHLSSLQIHTRIHTGEEKPFGCNYCSKKFNTSYDLKRHLRIHTGESPFECEKCGKKFKRFFCLKQHLRIHTGETPFACKLCNKKFNQLSILIRHRRIHTGENPFACKFCCKKFNQLASLKGHLRIHTGETPFACKS